ncbi:MAG: molybdopterin-binding/glycosyltransferase family 2 protein [Sulfuritalea sp.]|nr:molybdopterin-binding/glycosyltransferase family 2 protein [Sulfuritalea sp.]MDP1982980.1 molybdopterin-binding/glycosyltransferase family 2 protein [Sulfuritalea sp.]
MIFGEFPIAEAAGLLLAHSLRVPGGAMRKGHRVTSADSLALAAAGYQTVHGARLAAGDLDEDAAAAAVAALLAGPGVVARRAYAGRCNLHATQRGLTTVDAGIIERINRIDEAVTVATLPPLSAVRAGAVVATVKVIPLAVGAELIARCAAQAGQGAALGVLPYAVKRAALIVTEQPGDPAKNYATAVTSSRRRVEDLGSHLGLVQRCAHRREAVAQALREALAAGCELLMIAGATVPKDRADIIPAAIVAAGGEIVHFGMPVEPGNMLLLARIGAVPVIILPGCARSRRTNGLDWVLQRMLAGLPMGAAEIMGMGVGGLIRSAPEAEEDAEATEPVAQRSAPGRRVAALVLAAGSSRRMAGENKLLAPVGGVPMVRRAANAALASRCTGVVVVTGFAADAVREALAGLDLEFVHNPAHESGMASSLRAGLAALAALTDDADAAVVVLGDMPGIDAGHIDRLIAAFDPRQPKVVVPIKDGRRGNPILWPRAYFAEMQQVQGDVGARELLQRHAAQVEAVACDDDAIFADVDTPAALSQLSELAGQ